MTDLIENSGNQKNENEQQSFEDACRFIIELGTAVHSYGPSAARLENYLTQVVEALGFHGMFRSTPSDITFAFWRKDELWQRTHMAPVPAGGYNMAKLSQVGDLVEEVVSGKRDLAQASERLEEIEKSPNPWGLTTYALSFILVGIGFAGLM